MSMQDPRGQSIDILVVEDNPGDVRLMREALRDAKVRNTVVDVSDGEAALDYLHRRGRYTGVRRPDVIFLDLNLPRKDGREVLAEIKASPDLREIPVVIITTSQAEEDIVRSYQLHANCYVTKPIDFDQFLKVVEAIEEFWLTIVRLPSAARRGTLPS